MTDNTDELTRIQATIDALRAREQANDCVNRLLQELMQCFQGRLAGHAYGKLTEVERHDPDMVDAIISETWAAIAKVLPNRRFESEAQFRAYLFTTCDNIILGQGRAKAAQKHAPDRPVGSYDTETGEEPLTAIRQVTPGAVLTADETRIHILAAARELPLDQRTVWNLIHLGGYEPKQIAEALKLDIAEVNKLRLKAQITVSRTRRPS